MKKSLKILLAASGILVVGYLLYVYGIDLVLKEAPESRTKTPERVFSWKSLAPLPTPRTGASAAVLDGEIYVIGGLDSLGGTTDKVEVYNPERDSWRVSSSLPKPRHHAGAAVVGGRLYVLGGDTALNFEPHDDVFIFDKEIERWSAAPSLPDARGAFGVAVSGRIIYVVGGRGRVSLADTLFAYTPDEEKWFSLPKMSTKRDHLAAGAEKGVLYVAGGREGSLSQSVGFLEQYDMRKEIWSLGPAMPSNRGGVAGQFVGGFFVVAGGEGATRALGTVEAFDPLKNEWIRVPDLPTPRHGVAAVVIGNKIYFIGGSDEPGISVSGANEVLTVN